MQTNTTAQLEKRPCLQVNAAAHHALALVQQNQQHPAHVLVGQAGEVISQTHHRGAHVSAGSVHVSATQTSVQQQQQQFPHVLGDQTVGFGPPQQQQLLQQVAVGQTGMGGVRRAGEMIGQTGMGVEQQRKGNLKQSQGNRRHRKKKVETDFPAESGAFLSCSSTPAIRTPAMVEVGKLPNYTDVETDNNGNAILPSDFFPNILDNLPLEWFYKTYSYFPFFDRKQRDESGILCVPANMRTATEGNVAKWKDCVMMLGDQKFKDTGKLMYGYEIGRMAAAEGYMCKGKAKGPEASTINLVFDLLFNHVAPPLLAQNQITKLIALAYKIMYVPCLEGNNQWLKNGLQDYLKGRGANVVLSEQVTGNTRLHSLLKYFKKYATQSAHQMFRRKQKKEWKFVLEHTMYRSRDGSLPECKEKEQWTDHDISGYLEESTKSMMTRNGGYRMLVRHFDSVVSVASVLAGDIHCAMQRALASGCTPSQICEQLEAERVKLMGSSFVPAVPIMSMGQKERTGGDPFYQADIENLLDFENIEEQMGLEGEDGLLTHWANGTQSPVPLEQHPLQLPLLGPIHCQVPLPQQILPPTQTVDPIQSPVPPLGNTQALPGPPKVSPIAPTPAVPPSTKETVPSPAPAAPLSPAEQSGTIPSVQDQRKSTRHRLSKRQKEASDYIHKMQECQRHAFQQLEKKNTSPPEMYVESGRSYHKEIIGMYRCHFRALFNVSKEACTEAINLGIRHEESEKVLGVLKKYVDGADGKIFHLRKQHWVALERISGTDKAIYFDDMIMMYMENYEGSVATLNIVQEMSPAQYDTVFYGSNKLADKVRQLHQKQTKVSNVLDEYW